MDYLKEKKEIEKKFNQVKSQLEQTNAQAKGLADELNRLQGEFRIIEKMERETSDSKLNKSNK